MKPPVIPESLRVRYADRLAHATVMLGNFADDCERSGAATGSLAELRSMTHKLHGSGSTLGFLDISRTAAALEILLENAPQTAAPAARSLAQVCRDAIAVITAENVPQAIPEAVPVAPPTLLLICHDEALCQDIVGSLSPLTDTTVASPGADAEQVLAERQVRLVVAEFDSLGHSADGLKNVVRDALRHDIPVIGLTAGRRDATVAHAISSGRILCFDKSLEMEKFRARVASMLDTRKQRVLLGDDDRIVRELLRSRFEAAGLEVLQAGDGEEVLAHAQSGAVDIIVLDRAMPKMDGLTALRMLKANPRTHEIPVIMLTTKTSPQQIAEGRRDGATAYILKPFSPDEVVLKCRGILNGELEASRVFAS